jgi:hypothetical protein
LHIHLNGMIRQKEFLFYNLRIKKSTDLVHEILKYLRKQIKMKIDIKEKNQFLPGDYIRGGIYIIFDGIDQDFL